MIWILINYFSTDREMLLVTHVIKFTTKTRIANANTPLTNNPQKDITKTDTTPESNFNSAKASFPSKDVFLALASNQKCPPSSTSGNVHLISPMFFHLFKEKLTVSASCKRENVSSSINCEDTLHGFGVHLCTLFAENTI